jgi:hypothetical protein
MSRTMGRVWRRWIKIATVIGNVQMTILLSLIYWTMVSVMFVPVRLLSDPLTSHRSRLRWLKREPGAGSLESMRRQG